MNLYMPGRKKSNFQVGQGLVEYILLLGIALMTFGSLHMLGFTVRGAYCSVTDLFGIRPAVCDSILLWEADFTDLESWNITQGRGWMLQDGRMLITQPGEHRAFTGDDSWEDYTVHVGDAVLYEGAGYGVYFRVSDEPDINGYAFQYDPGYADSFIIRKVVDGRELHPPIAVSRAPAGFAWYNTPHQIQIEVRGDTYTAYVDGTEVVTATDESNPTGRIGLRGWRTDAEFENLSVTQP